MSPLTRTPAPPYWVVVFTSLRVVGEDGDADGYAQTAADMERLAAAQPGYLGVDSVRDAQGVGITASYWASEEAIRAWKAVADHQTAQRLGRAKWYRAYEMRIAKVERAYSFARDD